jgi:D-alanine-D-alanine ligase
MPKQNQKILSWGERVKQELAYLDVKSLGRVGVLLGGRSGEREISLMSGNGVLDALISKGVDAHPFDPGLRCPTELVNEKFDRIFISLHGRYGEDGTIQGLLELLGLPYTGSGVLASALSIDKIATKLVWLSSGLSTPEFEELKADSDWSAVVKPLHLA